MTITVKDVTEKAGVAISTVSRIINDYPSISKSTKEKVRKVIDNLGHVPNMTARDLGKRISSVIDVILPPLDSKERLGNPSYLEIMKAVNEEARPYDTTTTIATARGFDVLSESTRRIRLQKRVDGFTLVYSDSKNPVINYLDENNTPSTLIGQPYQHETEMTYVDSDNQLLGKQATKFLIENGYKNISFMINTTHESLYFEHYFGYQKAMMMQGPTVLPDVALEKSEDYMAFDNILHQNSTTALVVINDVFTLRTIQLAQIYGYQIPETSPIISSDNSIFSTLTRPYLISIDIDMLELGRMATKRLYELIHEELTNDVRLVIPHKLIKRGTVIPIH